MDLKVPDIKELFDITQEIGKGAYGAVSKAIDRKSKDIVALKLVKREELKNGFPENSIREIKVLRFLHECNNIINLRKIVTCGSMFDVYMVFDYCPFDLRGLIYQTKMSKEQIICYFKQTCLAIFYSHAHNVLHRDIKPGNVFVQSDNVVKMGDFGLACSLPIKEDKPWMVITIWYRPPELLLGATNYGGEIDVWSLGCLLYEMITGKVLFRNDGTENLEGQLIAILSICGPITKEDWPEAKDLQFYNQIYADKIQKNLVQTHPNLEQFLIDTLPESFKGAIPILVGMLQLNPKKRVSVKDIYLDPFFSSADGIYDPKKLRPLDYGEIHEQQVINKANEKSKIQPMQKTTRPNPPKLV